MEKQNKKSLAQKAQEAVNAHKDLYNDDNKAVFDDIAKIWSVYIGTEITPLQVQWMMVALKMSRSKYSLNIDNYVDAIGYMICAEEYLDND